MITVEYLAPGTGASAVELDDFLDQFATDSGFSSLQAAVTAAAGKHLYVNRSWTLTSAVSIPADTVVELGPSVVITQSTNATSHLNITADNVRVTGCGKFVGTNTGDYESAAVEARQCYGFVLDGKLRFQDCRYGVALLPQTRNYRIEGATFWGGIADGTNSCDIFVYGNNIESPPGTFGYNERGVIRGNFCFSNNDSGIYVNAYPGDRFVTVSENIVCPLDSSGRFRLSHANVKRRYGIIMSYNGGDAMIRSISGNMVIGTAYGGIYATANARPVGSLNVNNNIVAECGFGRAIIDDTDAGLRAGAYFADAGRINGRGNMSINCYSVGLKIQDRVGYSDSTASRGSLQWHVEGTRNPTITPAAARGVHLVDRPSGLDLDLYVIHGTPTAIYSGETPTATEAAVIVDCTNTGCGDVTLRGRVEVTNDKGAVQITAQFGGTEIDHPIILDGMNLHGTSKTDGEFNSAIWFQGNVHARNLTIKMFDRGITYATTQNSRRLDLVFQNISIEDTDYGLKGAGTGLVVGEGLSFKSVGTERDGPWVVGTKRWDETGIGTVKFTGSAIPSTSYSGITTGFARGDHCEMSVPATSSPKGWMRSATTWVSTGNL